MHFFTLAADREGALRDGGTIPLVGHRP